MQKEMDAITQTLPDGVEKNDKLFTSEIKGFTRSAKRFPIDVISTRDEKKQDSVLCALLLCYSYHTGDATLLTTNMKKEDWQKGIELYEYITKRKFSEDLLFFND